MIERSQLKRVGPGACLCLFLAGALARAAGATASPDHLPVLTTAAQVRLLLNGPGDVQVLASPSWWTLGHALTVLGLMAVAVLAALEWVILLKRRVSAQTELIRQRLESEAALEQRYRQLVENASDIVYSHDLEGNFLSLNKAAEKITGYTITEALGANLTQIVAPKYLESVRQMIRTKFAEGLPATFEVEMVSKDGRNVSLEVCPRFIKQDGQIIGFEGIARDITERKRAEEALRKSEAMFNLIAGNVSDLIAVVDADGKRLYNSRSYGKILSEPAQLAGTDSFVQIHPEDRERVRRVFQETFRTEAGQRIEYRFLLPDGSVRHIESQGNFVPGDAGQPGIVVVIARDITERKRAEEALRETESLYRRAIAASDSVAYRRDYRNDSFSFIGPEISQMTGYSPQEMTPKLWESLVQETIMRGETAGLTQEEAIRRTRAGEFKSWHDDCRILTCSGETRWIADTSLEILNPQGEPTGSIGILQDITERKRAEEALRKSEELFSKAFRASPIPISISTEEGRYLDVNDSFLRLLGFKRQEVIGHTSLELRIWEKAEDRARIMQQLREHRSVRDTELTLHTKSGQLRNVLASLEFIELGSESGILSLLQDITERQNLEAQLRQSQKMESVGQLAGGIAHDFNNILTIVQGHVSLLLNAAHLEPDLTDSAKQISQAAERAAKLTRQLLAFGRRQFLQPAHLNLNEVVGKMSQMLQRVLGDDIVLQVHRSAERPMIRADAGMIDQILLNLAVNSRDAMPRGGRLTISTEVVTIDEDYLRRNPEAAPGQFVCLNFSDTGCGIAPEHLAHLFEPFFTTKDVGKGTGLGLATVYGIVKQHQGWVKVASEPGHGTTFQIFLPKCSELPETAGRLPGEDPIRGGAETILVVEDEPTVRNLVVNFLDRLGYKPLEAGSGVGALEVWRQHQHDIHLLLTDMVMPDGMSGRELAENLKAAKPQLKVVYTSGYSAEAVGKSFGLREGLNFLQKPYPPQKLARIIRDSLDR